MIKNNESNLQRGCRAVKKSRILPLLGAALLLVFLLSFSLGRYGVPLEQVFRILWGQLFPAEITWTTQMETAVVQLRLPHILLAMLVGASLSAAGTAYQSVFRNPMAAPDILGASSAACFGAAVGILLGGGRAAIIALAFVMSLGSIALVYGVSRHTRGSHLLNILLSGIVVSSLFSAGTSWLKLVADPTDQLPAITYWLMGSLNGTRLPTVGFAVIPIALGLVPLLLLRWRMNLLTVGREEALSMGVNVEKVRLIVILCATILTAASVSVSGMIGWVGLIIPNLCRKWVGSDCRRLIPVSMLSGALFLLVVDNVSRCLLAVEIPIGILTALIGAPFFLYLMTRKEYAL